MATLPQAPTWYWIASSLGFLWNFLGIFNYLGQVTLSPEALSELPQAQQNLINATPAWVMGAFAIAVFAGTLGCLFLLLRKKWASPLLMLSFVAALLQVIYNVFVSDAFQVLGAVAVGLPILILGVGSALIWIAKKATAAGWIT